MNFLKRKYYQLLSKYLKNKPDLVIPYLKAQYFLKNERKLNIEEPKEFMEKLQWLNQNYYGKEHKKYVDKYEVRDYVSKKVGQDVLVDIIGVYNNVEDIDFNTLPNQFALKGTHGSGYNIIVGDKSQIKIPEVRNQLRKFLKSNYYHKYKERIYKDIEPRILVEKFLDQGKEQNIIDYKFYCIHGKPVNILVKTFDGNGYKKCFYDMNWKKLSNGTSEKNFLSKEIRKPDNFNRMLDIAKELSKDFIFVRVDLYSISNKIYFGELTFFPTGGLKRLPVEHLNQDLGDLIQLPIKSDV